MLRLAVVAVCQFLEPVSSPAEVGVPAAVRAVDARGAPLVALQVSVRTPAGELLPIGTTGPDGTVAFAPAAPGDYELRARLPADGALLITPLRVVLPPRRWLWAIVCTPLGLALLWTHWRRRPALDD